VTPALLVLSLLLNQGYAPARQGLEPLDATREDRVQVLGKKFRCAVCQGVSISDSPASMARAQLDKVRELVAEGKNDQEIEDYFVARYGEWVLLEPRKNGLNAFLWVGPVLMLLIGIGIILASVKKKPPGGPGAPAPVADDYLAQVRADLNKP
jgi:cytochrome c-type biogenesis protein CcmH